MSKKIEGNKNNGGSFQEDGILINTFLEGNEESFDHLVLKYQDRIFGLCLNWLGDYAEAEECAQVVFVKVYKYLENFKFDSSFSTWLFRIAVNTCKNRIMSLRFKNNRKTINIEEINTMLSSDLAGPVETLEKKEKSEIVREVVGNLPRLQKEVIIMRDLQGMSYEEISEILNIKQGTVKSRIARGRNILRKMLKGVIF
ncbi:MAG: RNA polymerase sigma factor [Elusimicrobiota bacterium]